MYMTQTPAPGSSDLLSRVSTGLIFVPTKKAPPQGRPVVAWNHGTLGLGRNCAPSRLGAPLGGNSFVTVEPGKQYWVPPLTSIGTGFINNMLDANWVVTATDYTGIGPLGTRQQMEPLGYLVGASEAYDTMNAVRAARSLKGSDTTPDYAVYGQSQGGHAAVSVGNYAQAYAPDLSLKAIAASDPAIELKALVENIYDQPIAWNLGPSAVLSWSQHYPDLDISKILTPSALKHYESRATKCILFDVATGFLHKEPFFTDAVLNDPAVARVFEAQTPTPYTDTPLLVSQATIDGIIAPQTVAKMQDKWCAAGANLRMNWVSIERSPNALNGQLAHVTSAMTDATTSIAFINDHFTGSKKADSMTTACSQPPPPFPTALP